MWRVGLVVGVCNLLGGYVGARTAVARGSRFVRIFFIVVVSAFIVRIGGRGARACGRDVATSTVARDARRPRPR